MKPLKLINPATRIEELDAELAEIQPRKEYQSPASLRREYFQQQINVLTDRLIRWQEIADEVNQKNKEYRALVSEAARQANRADERVARFRRVTVWSGIASGVLFLLGISPFGAWWLLVLALLAAGVTAGAGYGMKRAEADADEASDDDEQEIKELRAKLEGLYEYAEGDEELIDEDEARKAANA